MSVEIKDTIEALTVEDLIHGEIEELRNLAIKAEKHEKIVKGYKGFRIGEKQTEFLLHSFRVKVTLTYDGVWTAERGKDWDYRMKINKEAIFDLYKTEWKVAKGQLERIEEETSCLTVAGKKSEASEAFKAFIELISSK